MYKKYADFMDSFVVQDSFFKQRKVIGSVLIKWLSFNFLPANHSVGKPDKIHPAAPPDYSLALGEVQIFESPVTIVCSKIGASIGVFIWDPCTEVSGAAYILWSGKGEYGSGSGEDSSVNATLDILFNRLMEKGSDLRNLQAKIVGGSDIFAFGKKNVECVLQILNRYEVKIEAADVGGDYCRLARFNSSNNLLLVKTAASSYYKIY